MNAIAGNSSPQQRNRTKYFNSTIKSFFENTSTNTQEKPDVPILTSLFQSIGFRLCELEKSENVAIKDGLEMKSDAIRVIIECGNSRMKACLELDDVKCKCPKPEDTKDASFWSISGTGPTNPSTIESVNKIEETGSNLLPSVSKDTAKMITNVIYHLFNVIGEKSTSDANQNSKTRSNLNLSRIDNNKDPKNFADEFNRDDALNFVRSRTQPEIVFNNNKSLSLQKSFKETSSSLLEQKIDAERDSIDQPRSSPPKIRSSPIFICDELCSSLDSISLKSEEDVGNLATYVNRAHKNLEKALEIIARRSPTNERPKFLKPTARSSISLIVGDSTGRRSGNGTGSSKTSPSGSNSRPGSSCSMPSRGSTASRITLASANPKATQSRRNVGSTLTTKISTSSKTSVADIADGSSNKNSVTNDSTASKIPGRRRTFHSLRPAKLSLVGDKNNSLSLPKDVPAIPSISTPNEKQIVANQSAIPKLSTSLNLSSIIPTLKVAPIKVTGQKDTKETTRRSLGNLRFGYGSKK